METQSLEVCPDCDTPLRPLGDGTLFCPNCKVGWVEGGGLVGKVCYGVPCLVFSRVVGFITPVSQWNIGKKQEWKDRVTYTNVPQGTI